MSHTLQNLRQLHPQFIYKKYSWEIVDSDLLINFFYEVVNSEDVSKKIEFNPNLTIYNVDAEKISNLQPEIFENFVFNLGMIEILSYWKATCSPEILIEAGRPTNLQISWWHNLLIKGLGEFFYVNNIDFSAPDFVKISSTVQETNVFTPSIAPHTSPPDNTYLIPVGGGKDSATVLGLFDQNNIPYSCFVLEPHSPSALEIINASHPQSTHTATRQIDPTLLLLNRQGYLNGHTPFSAYLAFVSSFVAWIFGQKNVVLSNENSANEGNVTFHNHIINHQYSKTFEFEKNFRQYLSDHIFNTEKEPPVNYFSLLRPLYEIQIAKLFAGFPQYHSVFKSCNVGQKQNIWCHHCPKCLFVFTMLFPFIDEETLTTKIFDHNLFDDETLLPMMLELMGKTEQKPFECVGTYEEVIQALQLSIKKATKKHYILEEVEYLVGQYQQKNLLENWNQENFVAENLLSTMLFP